MPIWPRGFGQIPFRQHSGGISMKIALAQINTTVGDVDGNTRKAADAIHRARDMGADLVLLPEMTLSGYPPLDLAERTAFLEANERAVIEVARAAGGIFAVVGHLARVTAPQGKAAANAASLVRDGRVLQRRDKTLLPTYDVFDEARYFQPAAANQPVQIGSVRAGLTICEDMWNDRFFWERRLYDVDPVEEMARAGMDLLLNIAASPFSASRQQVRRAMVSATARRHGRKRPARLRRPQPGRGRRRMHHRRSRRLPGGHAGH
jgi:predicted amidohydrolase